MDYCGPSGHAKMQGQKCECGEEECDAERLWTDFENCAQTVTRLYREANWRTLQTAAASTTQLYKTGLDSHRKAYDKGFEAGRHSLAKELISACGGKIDLNRLLEILGQGSGRGLDGGDYTHRSSVSRTPGMTNESAAAVQLFHQALAPAGHGASPQRTSSELTQFLTGQIQKRKRGRSPPSPSQLFKRFKRM